LFIRRRRPPSSHYVLKARLPRRSLRRWSIAWLHPRKYEVCVMVLAWKHSSPSLLKLTLKLTGL
jgi:hypothetical protein